MEESEIHYDLIVLGGGPGGYSAAIRAAQLGLKTALVEKEGVGGTCLHHGCIPSKALLKSADLFSMIQHAAEFGIEVGDVRPNFPMIVQRSEKIVKRLHQGVTHLMKKNKIEIYEGVGRFLSPMEVEVLGVGEDGCQRIISERVILATGSRVRPWPSLPADGKRVWTSDEALTNPVLPRSMVILGGGAVGVEFASLYASLGVEVTIVEMAPYLLPTEDQEISLSLKRVLQKRNVAVLVSARVESIDDREERFVLRIKDVPDPLRTDSILVAVGRIPNTEGLDLKKAGVLLDEASRRVLVNAKMQTSQKGIWAIGDVTTRPALAHGAMAQGIYVVETIAGIEREPIDLQSVPNTVYCQPEVASVGLTEEAAHAADLKFKVVRFPLAANPRAVIQNEAEGFVKLICDDPGGLILGAHLIGPNATELISELVLAKNLGATALDIKRTIHPHPTFSEAVMEAGGLVFDQAIHL